MTLQNRYRQHWKQPPHPHKRRCGRLWNPNEQKQAPCNSLWQPTGEGSLWTRQRAGPWSPRRGSLLYPHIRGHSPLPPHPGHWDTKTARDSQHNSTAKKGHLPLFYQTIPKWPSSDTHLRLRLSPGYPGTTSLSWDHATFMPISR